ncbi:hypothetical protein [Gordonia oryzae]|uniref:hypothetical protein n=1 Tax=Gordonia oryzae TaxID=2487349 RepID=UPI003F82BB12
MLDGPSDPRHGTLSGYNSHKCHCERRRAAKAAAETRRRRAMTVEQRRAIDARRTPRTPSDASKARTKDYIDRRQIDTRANAREHQRPRTAEDIAVALRTDLTVWQAATLLGRTGSAVANARHRFRNRPQNH